jgi:hypothetical protein
VVNVGKFEDSIKFEGTSGKYDNNCVLIRCRPGFQLAGEPFFCDDDCSGFLGLGKNITTEFLG